MKYKILRLNQDGIIAFTQKELEELLDEIYQDGYENGRRSAGVVYYPRWTWGYTTTDVPLVDRTIITCGSTSSANSYDSSNITATGSIGDTTITLGYDYEPMTDPLPESFSEEVIAKELKGAF